MTWRIFLPGSWFEDLGSAKRVSRYTVSDTGRDNSGSKLWHFYLDCDVKLHDGSISHEHVGSYPAAPGNTFGIPSVPSYLYERMKEDLKESIRKKYPKNEENKPGKSTPDTLPIDFMGGNP